MWSRCGGLCRVLVVCRIVVGALGWVSVGLCGWLLLWSGCCEGFCLGLGLVCGVQWVVWFAGVGGFGFGLGLGFGVLLVGQTVPDQ